MINVRVQRRRTLRDRFTVQSAIQRNDGLRPDFAIREPNHNEELSERWCRRCACVHISRDGLCPVSGVAYRNTDGRNEYDSNDDDSESEVYDAAAENITDDDERTAERPYDDPEPSSDDQDIGELSTHVDDRSSDPDNNGDNLHEYRPHSEGPPLARGNAEPPVYEGNLSYGYPPHSSTSQINSLDFGNSVIPVNAGLPAYGDHLLHPLHSENARSANTNQVYPRNFGNLQMVPVIAGPPVFYGPALLYGYPTHSARSANTNQIYSRDSGNSAPVNAAPPVCGANSHHGYPPHSGSARSANTNKIHPRNTGSLAPVNVAPPVCGANSHHGYPPHSGSARSANTNQIHSRDIGNLAAGNAAPPVYGANSGHGCQPHSGGAQSENTNQIHPRNTGSLAPVNVAPPVCGANSHHGYPPHSGSARSANTNQIHPRDIGNLAAGNAAPPVYGANSGHGYPPHSGSARSANTNQIHPRDIGNLAAGNAAPPVYGANSGHGGQPHSGGAQSENTNQIHPRDIGSSVNAGPPVNGAYSLYSIPPISGNPLISVNIPTQSSLSIIVIINNTST